MAGLQRFWGFMSTSPAPAPRPVQRRADACLVRLSAAEVEEIARAAQDGVEFVARGGIGGRVLIPVDIAPDGSRKIGACQAQRGRW
jgi:hypothetical protein